MKSTDRQEALASLHDALRTMDLPDHKKRPTTNDSLRWLAKSLALRNAQHARFDEAAKLIEALGAPSVTRTMH